MKRRRKLRSKAAPAKIVGEAEEWSDDEIDRMAQITAEDVSCAKAHARRLAPRRMRRTLDACAPSFV